jgi:hypothetical protein
MTAVQSDPETFLTCSQIAHTLGLHPSAPQRWILKGSQLSSGDRQKLQAIATPGGWRVKQQWLDDFLAVLTADRSGKLEDAPKPAPKSERVARMNAALAAAGF